jgi:PAS domain-containing protein
VHAEDVERAKQTFSEATRGSETQLPIEFRLRRADGSWRHVEAVRNNLLAGPSVCGIVSNIRDVTERKRAEEALRRSEERFRQLFEHSVDALFVLHDATREIVGCNQEARRSLGYSREELLALRFIDLAHTLGMKVIAEGVESSAQVEQLKDTGCELAQGYHFTEPLPIQALPEFR